MDNPHSTYPVEKPDRGPSGVDEHGHSDVNFEESTFNVRGVVWVLVAIAATFVLVALVAWWMLEPSGGSAQQETSAADYRTPTDRRPAEPRLESLDANAEGLPSNVFARELALEQILHSYGDTDEAGYVHIPIEKAMELAPQIMSARSGLPNGSEKSFGLLGGGEANSGRIYQEPPQWLQKNE